MAKQKNPAFSRLFGRNPRPESEIFVDLSRLCQMPGFIHAIAYITIRDNVVAYRSNIRPDDMAHLYNPKRLIRTEVNVLLGLMVQKAIDFTKPEPETLRLMVLGAEQLLEELHQGMNKDAWKILTPEKKKDKNFNPMTDGRFLREAMFYGGESAYYFQYRDFIIPKFSADDDWMKASFGFTAEECYKAIHAVGRVRNVNANVHVNRLAMTTPEKHSFLPAHQFSAADVAHRTKLPLDIVESVLAAFLLPPGEQNLEFNTVQDFNAVSARPLIRYGDDYLLFDIYNLVESAYQSPFHWMNADKSYKSAAMANRGKFTESYATKRLADVFGSKNVHTGVNIMSGKKIAGEIDVLVVFGDRLIILQAKSKQLTLDARRGNSKHIEDDFQKAIQSACTQGSDCAQLLLAGGITLEKVDGTSVSVPEHIEKIYLICAIADHYPGLAFQASQFLQYPKQDKVAPPFVMDLFHLDAMAEMLDTPLYFLSYVDRRSGYSNKLSSVFELSILGYHLTNNLWKDKKADLVVITDSNAMALDTAMAVRRDGLTGDWSPEGILTKITGTSLGKVLKQIEHSPNPAMIAFGLYALTMNEATLHSVSRAIDAQSAKARQDKKIYDFTLMLDTKEAGLTLYFGFEDLDDAIKRLMGYCASRKYVQKANVWFGLILNPTDGQIEFAGCIDTPWAKDAELDLLTKSMKVATSMDKKVIRELSKLGRRPNDPCTCGSGKKYKKCCKDIHAELR